MKKAVFRIIALGLLPAILAQPVGSVGLALRDALIPARAPAAPRFDQDALAAGALWMLWSYTPEIAAYFRHEHAGAAVSLAGLIGMFPTGMGPRRRADIRRWVVKYKVNGRPTSANVYTLMDATLSGKDVVRVLEERKIHATLEVDDGLTVAGDLSQLQDWLIRPLIWGAIESQPDGGRIEIRAWREENMAVISIRDNGLGNPPERSDQVWTYHLLAGHFGHSAFGLTFAEETAAAHGGTVDLAQESEKGSVATVRLPVFDFSDPRAPQPRRNKPGTIKAAVRAAAVEVLRDYFKRHPDATEASFHVREVLEQTLRNGVQWPNAKTSASGRVSGYLWDWVTYQDELAGPNTGVLYKKEHNHGHYFWARPMGWSTSEVIAHLSRQSEKTDEMPQLLAFAAPARDPDPSQNDSSTPPASPVRVALALLQAVFIAAGLYSVLGWWDPNLSDWRIVLYGASSSFIFVAPNLQLISRADRRLLLTGLVVFFSVWTVLDDLLQAFSMALGALIGSWFIVYERTSQIPQLDFSTPEKFMQASKELSDMVAADRRLAVIEHYVVGGALAITILELPMRLAGFNLHSWTAIERILEFTSTLVLFWSAQQFIRISSRPGGLLYGLPHPETTRPHLVPTVVRHLVIHLGSPFHGWVVLLSAAVLAIGLSVQTAFPLVYNVFFSRSEWTVSGAVAMVISWWLSMRYLPTLSVAWHERAHAWVGGKDSVSATFGGIQGITLSHTRSPQHGFLVAAAGSLGSATLALLMVILLGTSASLPEPNWLGNLLYHSSIAFVAASAVLLAHALHVAVSSVKPGTLDSQVMQETWLHMTFGERFRALSLVGVFVSSLILTHWAFLHVLWLRTILEYGVTGGFIFMPAVILFGFGGAFALSWAWWGVKKIGTQAVRLSRAA